jgi:ATP-dependent RNA helicase DeaD
VAALGLVLDIESPHARAGVLPHPQRGRRPRRAFGGHGYRVESLHGGMTQEQRDR